MTLSLAVANTGDGTGGLATIGGSAVGSTNYLYYSGWTGEMKSYAWTLLNSRLGDGAITIASPGTLALGYYTWQLLNIASGTPTLGPMYYQNLGDASYVVHWRILEAVRLRAVSLALSGVNAARYHIMWMPRQFEHINTAPAVLISPIGAELTPNRVTNQDDVSFPVVVGTVDTGDLESAKEMPKHLKWREQLARSLRYQRLAGVPEVYQVEWVPDAVVNPIWFNQAKLASFMLFRFLVRQTRGLT